MELKLVEPVTVPVTISALKIAKAAFPEWRGRKATVKAVAQVNVCDTSWSGGSRNEYRAVDLRTGKVALQQVGLDTPRVFGGSEGNYYVDVPDGIAIVEHTYYCGKDIGCRVYVRGNAQLMAGR